MSVVNELIEQSRMPKGFIGRIMLNIMNSAHSSIFQLGIKQINIFDIIMAFQTHYHWENLPLKIKEIYRVLNNHGQFIITAEKYKINFHMKEFKSKDEIKILFSDIGFVNIEYGETKNNMYIKGTKDI